MKANTALGLVLAAVSLAFLGNGDASSQPTRRRWGQALAVAVLLLGASTGLEYALGWDLGIDELLTKDILNDESRLFPGRMSPIAAVCFCLIGGSLLVADIPVTRSRLDLTSIFLLPLVLITLVALTGYLYEVRNFYQLGPYIRIAWQTALCFLVLAIGTLAARPNRGAIRYFTNPNLSGTASRRLLPAVVIVPLVIGWVRLWAQKAGYIGLELGTALFAVTLVVFLCTVVWMSAKALDATDRAREKSVAVFREFFNLGLVGLAQADVRTGRLLGVNSKMEDITGYTTAELREMTIGELTFEDDRDQDREAFGESGGGAGFVYG